MSEHNITANRLRDYVKFYEPNFETDSMGEQMPNIFIFDAWCDVEVKSGSKSVDLGAELTETMITVLMWFNVAAKSNQIIEWDGNEYKVQHIQPSGNKKSMIVTAKIIGSQSF